MEFPEINKNDIDFIERYLDGELTLEEQQSFNKRMSDDPKFKNLEEARKEMHDLWPKARKIVAVKEEVRRIYREGSTREKNIFRLVPGLVSQYRYYAIAASLVLLIGILSVLFFINKTSRNAILAENDKNKTYQVHKQNVQPEKGKMEIYKGGNSLIVLLKPDDGAVLSAKKEILFEWKYSDDSVTHFTIFKGADNSVVFTKKVESLENKLLLPAGTLRPGVYYWSIRDKNSKRSFKIEIF
jgi:hypothetical protein